MQAPRPPQAEDAAQDPALADGERKPRKRRRRRNGRPVEGAEAGTESGTSTTPVSPVQVMAKPVRGVDPSDSFLTRIGRKIRRMLAGT